MNCWELLKTHTLNVLCLYELKYNGNNIILAFNMNHGFNSTSWLTQMVLLKKFFCFGTKKVLGIHVFFSSDALIIHVRFHENSCSCLLLESMYNHIVR